MKKLITTLFTLGVVLCTVPALTAFAAEVAEPSNVTITVVIPGAEPAAPSAEEPPAPEQPEIVKVYPSDVTEIRDSGGWQIIKTYELSPHEKPEDIPRGSFERSGWNFTLTDITRRETANAETLEHTETITLDTDTKDLEKILPLLSQTLEYKTEDDFIGVLTLDVSSIIVETAGTKTSSYTMSVTREYPRLSAKDLSLVPKTVTDRGKTYTLAGVDWQVGNYSTVDYEQIADYYTAVATYTATGTSTTVTGYTTTAVYNGTLAKMSQGKTFYTAFFLGEEIRTPLEMVTPAPAPSATPAPDPAPADDEPADEEPADEPGAEPTDAPGETEGNNSLAWLAIIPCLGIMAGGAYYFIRKGKKNNEKNTDSAADADDDVSDGDTGSGC